MSSTSPESTPELELHPAIYADPPPTPPPSRRISTPKRLCSGGAFDGRVSPPSTQPDPPPPNPRELFSEAMAYIRAYEPDPARRLLNKIDQRTSAMAAKVQEANEVLDAMVNAQNEIALAQEAGNWRGVLKTIMSFETTMYFRSNGSPRRAYRFPLPKMWLFSACESYAYLGRVALAERTLNELVIVADLTRVEQEWLMGLIAYVSGHLRTCAFHLESIPPQAGSHLSRCLLERAKDVQNLEADDSYELLDHRTRKYVHSLYFQKLDAANGCPMTPRKRPRAFAAPSQQEVPATPASPWRTNRVSCWGRKAVSLRLKKVTSARSLFTRTLLTEPRQRAASTSAIGRLRHRILRPSVTSVEQSFREMDEVD